ncbi:Zn-dependent protease (includes SpoIVFB) [Salinihabitans flavidus]|uniref:Zinc metalloprotease n=1 Tax=Salinihabitans flavidus TaxID=569882 RepID=A0A1H8NFU0_9RHOB|nr:site-2 protease family protein [Salinihabitans flavidus]SEO28474.1 Zn-dependent protease (includes SpoIVFB) [Salinihabitans flavidus]
MRWSFPIGHLFGSQLRVHATFFLLLLLIAAIAYQEGGLAAAALNTTFVLVLFACVIAHEFGHALTARRFGIRTPDVTLLPIGGLARLERMPENPREEILVALAGPAVNVVIWAVLSGFFGLRTDPSVMADFDITPQDFLARVAMINLFLAVFNMIPAFPMDGGRVLRAVLSVFVDRVQATKVAASTGQILAIVFGFIGLTSGNIVLILIAVFVFVAAEAESSSVSLHAAARNMLARQAMITEFECLTPGDGLQAASSALIRTTQQEFPVLDAEDRLLGVLTRDSLYAALMGDRQGATVGDLMTGDIPTARLTTRLDKVLDLLHGGNVPAVAIENHEGRFIGYVTVANLGESLVVHGRG